MTTLSRICRSLGIVAVALAMSLPAIAGSKDEIPITTTSEEARQTFIGARQMFENARQDEARALFKKAIEIDPDFALGQLYCAYGSTSAIDYRQQLQKAVALAPKASEGERLLIESASASADNDPLREIDLLQQLVKKYPGDKRAHYSLGATYYGRDEDDKAIAEFNEATMIDKDFAPTYNLLGYAQYEKGNYDKSEEAFKNYIRLLPDDANPYDSLADLYTKMGRSADAIKNYEKAIELNPTFEFSQRKIGDNLVFMGMYDEARDAYSKAMEMGTAPSDKLTDIGRIAASYVYEGNYQQALVEREKLLQMASKEGLPEWEAGGLSTDCEIYLEMGNLDNAKSSLAECKKVVKGSALSAAMKENFAKVALFDEALIAAKGKDFNQAMAKANEYKVKIETGKDPKEIEDYHALLGRIDFEKADYDKAIGHLEQANQENPYTLYLLAVSESKTGDKAQAQKLFNKVANWNEASLYYAFVRTKAMKAAKDDMAGKE